MTDPQEQQARRDAQRAADITGHPIRVVRQESGEWLIAWLTVTKGRRHAGGVNPQRVRALT